MNKTASQRMTIKRGCTGAMSLLMTAGIVNFGATAQAAQYEALCGGTKCSVIVTSTEIKSPFGVIPAGRVAYWGNSGDTKTSVGTGVATTILFGGIGLLGFLAKNHQYNFTINGFDAEGKQVSMQFEFKNDKPAKLLMQELVTVSGLGMGQTRTVDEIRAAESGGAANPGELTARPPGVGSTKLDTMQASTSAKPKSNCWSNYLENNPAMQQWAEANPAQATQNQKRFDDC
jgi:hypothetical protein